MNSPAHLYKCILCGRPKALKAYTCPECHQWILARRRRGIGLSNPFSKFRFRRLGPPPTNTKH